MYNIARGNWYFNGEGYSNPIKPITLYLTVPVFTIIISYAAFDELILFEEQANATST